MDTSKIKPVEFKYNKGINVFDLKFNINDSLIDESVQSIAISSNKIYIELVDMFYEDCSTSDHILSRKDKIRKLTLTISDRNGTIINKKEFKVKFNDIAYFDFSYDTRSISSILLVFEYDHSKV